MIGGKKIISTLFPKVKELPKEIVENYARKANDGMIIFSPSKNVEREKSHFFCLKCGTYGETTDDTPTCPNCGNSNSRAPITSRRYSDECQIVRYIQQVDEYHDSQDAVQDAFYNITATYELFADAAAPATAALVHIYVRNAAINIYNKNKRHAKVVMLCDNIEEVAKDIVDEDADVQRIVIDNETTEIVSEAVDKLDDMYRDLIIMKYYYHMRNVDIAQVLNIDSNKVNGRIFRAKQKLKEILGTEAYERITR